MKRPVPKVLAIDDDPIFLRVLEAAVTKFGAVVKTVDNPTEFLGQAKDFAPDLYLVDLHLEESTGFELIEQLRKEHPKAAVVVISGMTDRSAVVSALENGADDFILKPLDRTLLASKLQRFIPTDEILEHLLPAVPAPGGAVEATLSLDAQLAEVDELGLRFFCRDMIPKGTVIKVTSDHLATMGVEQPHVLLTITSTEYESDKDRYVSYGEFDGVDGVFLQNIRKWLVSRGQ